MLQLVFSLTTLWWMILFLYIPACFGLIIIVLMQKGKGQGLAGAFGMGGGMDTIFGPRSSKSLPQKITYASAAVFMTLALIMSILSGRVGRSAAPDLVDDTPDATMEALFDPAAEPEGPVSTELDEAEELDMEMEEALDEAPLERLFDEAPETPAPAEDVPEPVEPEPDTPVEEAPADEDDAEVVEEPAPEAVEPDDSVEEAAETEEAAEPTIEDTAADDEADVEEDDDVADEEPDPDAPTE